MTRMYSAAAAWTISILVTSSLPPRTAALKYLSYYGTNITAQGSWLNLAIASGATSDAFYTQYKTPSLIEMPSSHVYVRGTGLAPGWEGTLERWTEEVVLPRMANKTAIGVFLGDEICCHNTSCWHDQLYPLSAKLRKLLGPKAILYENECGDSIAGGGMAHGHPVGPALDKIAPDLDWISIDVYKGFTPDDPDGASEAAAAKSFVEKVMYPRMAPHQSIVVVPGTFACSNTSYMPLALSGKSVVAKLKAYFEWSKTDPKMIAINPWHFNHRHSAQHAPPCDMELGAINIPGVVAELTKIGAWIKAQPHDAWPQQ